VSFGRKYYGEAFGGGPLDGRTIASRVPVVALRAADVPLINDRDRDLPVSAYASVEDRQSCRGPVHIYAWSGTRWSYEGRKGA